MLVFVAVLVDENSGKHIKSAEIRHCCGNFLIMESESSEKPWAKHGALAE